MTLGATELEQALGYRFVDSSLLAHALVHRSYSKDFPEAESNERLEYLGDAVLGWVVADFTYRDPESFPEGRLTDIRKTVVNTNALATVARRIGLGEHRRLRFGAIGEHIGNHHLARDLQGHLGPGAGHGPAIGPGTARPGTNGQGPTSAKQTKLETKPWTGQAAQTAHRRRR